MKFTSLQLILCAFLIIGCTSKKLPASPTPASTTHSTFTLTASLAYPARLETAYPATIAQVNPTAFYPPPAPGTPSTPSSTQPPFPSAPTQTETPRPTPEPLPSVPAETLYQVIQQGNLGTLYFFDCIKTGQPERPIFVKGFDGAPDTYHLIYRNNGNICLVAVVGYQAGIWTVYMYTGDYKGINYPAIRAEDASAYIEKKTCQKTKGQPILGEGNDGYLAWRVMGVDGINYDVYSVVGQTEAYTPNLLRIWAVKQGDAKLNWLQPSRCGVADNFATPEFLSTEIANQPFPTPVSPSYEQLNQGRNILEPYDRTLPFLDQNDAIYREYLGCTDSPDTGGLTFYNVYAPLSQLKEEINAYLDKFDIKTDGWKENTRPGFPNTTWDLTGWRLPNVKDTSLLVIKVSLLEIKGAPGEPVYIQTSVVTSIINDPAGYIDEESRFTPLIKICPGNKTWLIISSK